MHKYSTAAKSASDLRPSITSIVSQHVDLRKAGREHRGLCPFHSEKHPSFTVNDDKGVFHCFGCGVGGDVITFVQLIEGLSFKEALKRLDLDHYTPCPRPHRQRAQEIARWASDMSDALSDVLHDITREIRMTEIAGELGLNVAEYRAELDRQAEILVDFQDDLFDADLLVSDFWKARQLVEDFIGGL